MKMIVEYRSDLNGGLDEGFWLNEFGIYAYDPDEGEVLIYYGCLGNYPQWVSAASSTGVDVRRYPVCIDIGDESGVEIDYSAEAWMTSEDVAEYCMVTVLPIFLQDAQELIDAHNIDVDAHYAIRNDVTRFGRPPIPAGADVQHRSDRQPVHRDLRDAGRCYRRGRLEHRVEED